jgi:hypothetical protein
MFELLSKFCFSFLEGLFGITFPYLLINKSYYMDERESGLVLQIDCKLFMKRNHFSWRRSKRFMFGSLLLFSFDDFKSFGTGVVRKADKKKMDEDMRRFGSCEIFIQIVNTDLSLLQVFNHYKGKTLVLLESRSYFEAFSHTMQTLKEMQSVPFEAIIRGMPNFTLNQPDFFYEKKKVYVRLNSNEYYTDESENGDECYADESDDERGRYQIVGYYETQRHKKKIKEIEIEKYIAK